MIYTRIASDGKPIEMTDIPAGLTEKAGIKNGILQPTHKRDIKRAGKTVTVAGWEVTYDDLGYCTKVVKLHGKSAENPEHIAFTVEGYPAEYAEFVPNTTLRYADGAADSDDGVDFCVHDGGFNYMGRVNRTTGEITVDGEGGAYKEMFLKAAKKAVCG